jgi:hypothetical protein
MHASRPLPPADEVLDTDALQLLLLLLLLLLMPGCRVAAAVVTLVTSLAGHNEIQDLARHIDDLLDLLALRMRVTCVTWHEDWVSE